VLVDDVMIAADAMKRSESPAQKESESVAEEKAVKWLSVPGAGDSSTLICVGKRGHGIRRRSFRGEESERLKIRKRPTLEHLPVVRNEAMIAAGA
jgi:hypothetical protein